ncbi:MAG: bifunctional phosphoribosylaminoimidazolecarboxamide formyltransferase/IMP cyclohydrolase, partial [Planctomycetes bacterium]|nr:bifunctional phosphoribosylaminoimidazolecarboxamide formyltransferase/IMP cyclohydrolase [Planctomycetota bacterium]
MTTTARRRALISVSDKTGLVPFAAGLVELGFEILSTGGTRRLLADAGLPVTDVAEYTGFPEMMDGRVKTLHPKIHGAILGRPDRDDDREAMTAHGIVPFELVVCNLYPFEETAAKPGVTFAEAIEQIDIGGPSLIRAAAKNHDWVAVVVSPDRYGEIVAEVDAGGTTAELRMALAREAFFRTAKYDAAIVNWLHGRDGQDKLVLPLEVVEPLRYGENPHQPAALYSSGSSDGWWARATRLQGKAMSFNNYADADAAWRLVNDLPENSVAILKHMNACGVATAATMVEAFAKAWACDPTSAFGGVVACNGELDGATAQAIGRNFVEIVIARSTTDEAGAVLARKKNLRLIAAPPPSGY